MKEFDALRSMEVDEAITNMAWLRNQGKYMKMLTTNSRTIKCWKIFEKVEKKMVKTAGRDLLMPKLQATDAFYNAQVQLSFPNKHHSSINTIGTSRNEEYLLSSDDVHCYMWNFEKPTKPFKLVDLLGESKLEEIE